MRVTFFLVDISVQYFSIDYLVKTILTSFNFCFFIVWIFGQILTGGSWNLMSMNPDLKQDKILVYRYIVH